ncbi:Programmed cell death toxin YdcE [uncultured Gammaproteobacteria bacterium]|uniref:type II toxin-antitoxin system PemK/MazF family toxin n=1 Tax=Bathymodiolus heckerae thiotrophic gill symbiont TaxID=1052212 RepID=UPI0010B37172|nr:type II toxin-antitoxin system PemK/MazF family toxin [Bathymodiolus heckerae thiotrophic gill symbiont]CAC9546198.1 Programmed cell death toxin YdcE [uncultured Gammaproteobacteria bacterium]CAC9957592.1 Programmed cell death toxin YdcE [uncultured Gammaproteobacteria bacterium]CAC9960583.1 Programmed cell death toxin YdcE [uncultured Gammaproteobacteria bacterium]SHN92413.1 Programmed cell death toxin YdcE [Bathymodiolus heckerae thiotrophic gill symbiont]
MNFTRGNIYLANMNPSRGAEIGKIRPVLVIQSSNLNLNNHKTVNILPLSTVLIDDSTLRFRIKQRDQLKHDSDVICDYVRAIDINKITSDSLTKLSQNEMKKIEEKLSWILGFHDEH